MNSQPMNLEMLYNNFAERIVGIIVFDNSRIPRPAVCLLT